MAMVYKLIDDSLLPLSLSFSSVPICQQQLGQALTWTPIKQATHTHIYIYGHLQYINLTLPVYYRPDSLFGAPAARN